MTIPELWRPNRRIMIEVGLFAACFALAAGIRALVAADTLGDLATAVLQFGGLFALIGATAYATTGSGPARTRAERVAARLIPIGLLLVGTAYVHASYVDVSVALHALASPASDGDQTIVVLGPGGHDIRISGELVEGAARRLADLLDAHPEVERIHLTSEGGLVDEGDALRKVIAAHRLTTFVPDYCVSACTLAFLGGRARLLMTGARIGFHAPFEEGLFGRQFASDTGTERATYIAAGVAANFVDEALGVAPAEIWTPEPEQMIAAHVATGTVDRYAFPDSNLDGIATIDGARETVLRNFPAMRTLEMRKPGELNKVAAWYLAAYRKGLSEGRVVDGLNAIVDGAASIAVAGR